LFDKEFVLTHENIGMCVTLKVPYGPFSTYLYNINCRSANCCWPALNLMKLVLQEFP